MKPTFAIEIDTRVVGEVEIAIRTCPGNRRTVEVCNKMNVVVVPQIALFSHEDCVIHIVSHDGEQNLHV